MPTRLTWFRLTAAVVIGLAFTALPRDVAYPLALFAFLIAVGAGFVEEVPGRLEEGIERPLQRAAQRALTLSALLALLIAEPDSAHVLAPPLLATLLRDLARSSLREATSGYAIAAAAAKISRWRARGEFLAVAALLAAGALPEVVSGGVGAAGVTLLWIVAALGLYEIWREYRAGLAFLAEEAERAAAEAAAAAGGGPGWARIPALRKDRREKG